jgi:hypothetical protein
MVHNGGGEVGRGRKGEVVGAGEDLVREVTDSGSVSHTIKQIEKAKKKKK